MIDKAIAILALELFFQLSSILLITQKYAIPIFYLPRSASRSVTGQKGDVNYKLVLSTTEGCKKVK